MVKHPTGMEEVIALENIIRAALAEPAEPVIDRDLRADAQAIMTGQRPASGTRLEALREIARRMGKVGDVDNARTAR
jgi:hypothetical protein